MSGSWQSSEFPELKDSDFKITSEKTRDYNCLAWAAAESHRRWEPDDMEQYYWPPNATRSLDLPSFVDAYRTLGYELCNDSTFEHGFEKITIYATSDKIPTHAARQLENGHWTSKLGDYEDIEHYNLECLCGEELDHLGRPMLYGEPVAYMKRRRV